MFGEAWDMNKVNIDFEPLWNLSETELATIRSTDATTIATLAGTQQFSGEEIHSMAVKRELVEKEESMLDDDGIVEGPAPDPQDELSKLLDDGHQKGEFDVAGEELGV